jgi:hypothetical protein
MPEFSKIVDEILQLLGEAEEAAPVKEDEQGTDTVETDTEPPVKIVPPDTKDNRAEEALKLKESYQKRLATGPTGLRTGQSDRLSKLRTAFTNFYTGTPNLDRLDSIKKNFDALLKEFTTVKAEVDRAKQLTARVGTLAIAPGATTEEQDEVTKAHKAAETAVNEADSETTLGEAEKLVVSLADIHARVILKVTARAQKKTQIEKEALSFADLPEAEFNTFQTKRDDVAKALATSPLTDAALLDAEAALVELQKAHATAEAAAIELRQIRVLFTKEAADLRVDVTKLVAALPKNKQGTGASILKTLTAADKLLLLTATGEQTRSFPEKMREVKLEISGLLGSVLGVQNDAGKAGAAFLKKELDRLVAESKNLPQIDDDAEAYAVAAGKKAGEADKKLGDGGGNKASAARPLVEALAKIITEWREYVGPLAIVLEQRRDRVLEVIKEVEPKGAEPAFVAALKSIRTKARANLDKKLTEAKVVAAEDVSAPFPTLLAEAKADFAAETRAKEAKQTLETGDALTTVISGARKAAATELTRAFAAATARLTLKGMDRGMTRTAQMFEDLVLRMQEVGQEVPFSEADKTPFAGLDDDVQETANRLCGPAVVGKMSPATKKALNAALKKSGPAVIALAEEALGGDPKVLEKVLTKCGADGLTELADAMGGDTGEPARQALDGLMEKGSLGDDPELLIQLIGEAPKDTDPIDVANEKRDRQKKNAAGLKSMAENFSGDTGVAAMNTLMKDCALGASTGGLVSLMQEDGFDGDGAKVRQFADAFGGDGDEAKASRADFSRLVKTAGVAEHPKVLGPIAKKSGAAGVKKIGAAFTTEKECEDLKGMLDNAGLGGDTSIPGKQHEHPDTLSKVFTDGFGEDADKLKKFTKAFSGGPKQAQAKVMFDAWNEFPKAHKDERKPGKHIAKVMGRMTGTPDEQISKLQTQFTEKIDTGVDDARKASAYRYAPDLASEKAPNGLAAPGNMPVGYNLDTSTQGQSLCRRHVAKYFSRATMKAQNTLWPPETDAPKLTAYLGQAIGANPGTMPGRDPFNTPNRNARDVDIGGGKRVEFAARSYDGNASFKVNHLHPGGGWPQTADPNESINFPQSDMESMLDAVGVV